MTAHKKLELFFGAQRILLVGLYFISLLLLLGPLPFTEIYYETINGLASMGSRLPMLWRNEQKSDNIKKT